MSSSRNTLATVKMSVVTIALQKSEFESASLVVAESDGPAQRDRPATRTLYSCSDSQIA